MKNRFLPITILALAVFMTGCQNGRDNQEITPIVRAQESHSVENEVSPDILIAYFDYEENTDLQTLAGAADPGRTMTGNTGKTAAIIHEMTAGDLFSIKTMEKYPTDQDQLTLQVQEEQNGAVRPGLENELSGIERYGTVFLGYSSIGGEVPMALYSFMDQYDLSGKTVIPFCISDSGDFSDMTAIIQGMEPETEILDGLAVSTADLSESEELVTEWMSGLGYSG